MGNLPRAASTRRLTVLAQDASLRVDGKALTTQVVVPNACICRRRVNTLRFRKSVGPPSFLGLQQ